MPARRAVLALSAAGLVALALPARAHHGIVWVEEEPVTIRGRVVREMTGNPHFEIRVQSGETRWTIDLGNAFRMQRAGLRGDGIDMPLGKEIEVEGHRASDESLKLIRAIRIRMDGRDHILLQEGERHY